MPRLTRSSLVRSHARSLSLSALRLAPAADPPPAASDLPARPPHNKVPFAAPPGDESKGQLGQVYMPDMQLHDQRDPGPKIGLESVGGSALRWIQESFARSRFSFMAISTAVHPSTLPGGGPSSSHTGDDTISSGGEGPDRSASSSTSSSSTSAKKQREEGPSGEKYEWDERPLDDQERRGLYQLGGILAGGLFLGWATEPKYART
ncbi:hypothetical protein Rhopal_001812-T1 [Rhodotorula paludigena]|uniref:Uncharacterized protein n=1 Tax=Rhodotorula paludigena TaxID=86838 RepID=A0AAV5GGZ3_9BASI|nr:hypothetical protein Rhopal_001812-T1 [Rhodotorula paludigena]